MIVLEVIFRCTICGYRSIDHMNDCPKCNGGQGHKWESPNVWPYGTVCARLIADVINDSSIETQK
jgi:hypothetical protein